MQTKKFTGKHTCDVPFLIYRDDAEPWNYICPVCRFPIDIRQAVETKDDAKESKFEGRMS